MKAKKSRPLVAKWRVGDIVIGRVIVEVTEHQLNAHGNPDIMYGWRYEGESEDEPLLWSSQATLKSRTRNHTKIN